jgi:ADP-glucose pyrophosphorylase
MAVAGPLFLDVVRCAVLMRGNRQHTTVKLDGLGVTRYKTRIPYRVIDFLISNLVHESRFTIFVKNIVIEQDINSAPITG